jgi:hypothetical protein
VPLNIKRPRKQVAFYEDRAAGMLVTAAEKDLAEVRKKYADRLASKAVRDAEKALEQAKAAAAETVLDLTLEALPKKVWAEAEEACPPREGDTSDKAFNVNVDTFLAEVLGKSVVEVRQRGTGELRTDVTAEDWAEATSEMDDGQYSALLLAILELNRNATNPF